MSATPIPGLTLAGEPRAQLLPPSVKEREKTRSTRRLMGLLVILSLVVAGGAVAWAYLQQMQSQQALAAAQQRTTEIQAEQLQYTDASRLADLLAQTQEAQVVATSTEIQWRALANEIARYVPEGAVWTGVAFQAPAPWESALLPEGPLREPRAAIATIELTGSSYGPAAVFVTNIPAIYGFSDVRIDQSEFKDGVYTTSIKVTLDADAISERFAADVEGDDDE